MNITMVDDKTGKGVEYELLGTCKKCGAQWHAPKDPKRRKKFKIVCDCGEKIDVR